HPLQCIEAPRAPATAVTRLESNEHLFASDGRTRVRSMSALAHSTSPSPGTPAAPPLHAVGEPGPRPAPRFGAWDVARFAVGLTAGFLLAAVASAPGGGAMVAGQLALAAASAVVAAVAGWRSHVATRTEHRSHSGAART